MPPSRRIASSAWHVRRPISDGGRRNLCSVLPSQNLWCNRLGFILVRWIELLFILAVHYFPYRPKENPWKIKQQFLWTTFCSNSYVVFTVSRSTSMDREENLWTLFPLVTSPDWCQKICELCYRELHRLIGVSQGMTSVYHPQTFGLVDKLSRTIKK